MTFPIHPMDEFNAELVRNVHPPDWKNPEPQGRYNLVVIGAGSAGLITAAVAAGLGARVALVERHHLGGDCLNVGCVPSKGVIRAARLVADARRAAELGLPLPRDAQLDFGAAMQRMRRIRAQISHEDAAKRYRDELGVDVFLGDARFTGSAAVDVNGQTLRFARAVIASGGRPVAPEIPGIAEVDYLTNETLFNLTERPARFGVIGSGPIGCEMAQAFRRLGSQVVVFERGNHILPREDADAAEIVQRRFLEEGIELALGCRFEQVSQRGAEKLVHVRDAAGALREVAVDQLLVAAGRAPNVEGMGLERVGVEFDLRRGIRVDDQLRTTNPHIFAAGDCCMDWKFTHAADAAAKIVVRNALFFGRDKLSSLVMPWCTYTDPEVAHVGLYPREAAERGIELDTYHVPLEQVNRAVADGEAEGFVKIHTRKGRDEIVGATVVASHAGDWISQVTLAMVGRLGLGTFAQVIFPYPTQAEALKRASGAYMRTRLTPAVAKLFGGLMKLRRNGLVPGGSR
jgi:pyruvate/2-oxoglutarate dehydrogenase complex dihydrolipoamide dehydrogenase (E3) component